MLQTITAKIPSDMNSRLHALARKTDRNRSYIIRRALEEFLDDQEDYYEALAVLARKEKTYTLEQVEKELGLDN